MRAPVFSVFVARQESAAMLNTYTFELLRELTKEIEAQKANRELTQLQRNQAINLLAQLRSILDGQ
jgi:hypothetical protein